MTTERSPRVVSLLPAGTEIIAALGAMSALVGITHECDYPPEAASLPRVTSSAVDRDATSSAIDAQVRALAASGAPVFALDADQLALLAPTLILTQSLCEVCAVDDGTVRAIAHVVSPPPRMLALVGTTLAGVWEDIRQVAAAIGRADVARVLLATLDARLRHVHETLETAHARRPRVAVIEWLDPVFAAGHWTPDLVRRAGGVDVLAEPGAHSVPIAVQRVRELDPELIFFAPCGFHVERAELEAHSLLATDPWAWVWSPGRELWAMDGNSLTSRPGPRLVEAVEVMAAIVAPNLFPAPPANYARRLIR